MIDRPRGSLSQTTPSRSPRETVIRRLAAGCITAALLLTFPATSAPAETGADRVDVSGPVPRSTPPPVYPDFAREARIDGSVLVHVLVGKDGQVETIKLIKGITGLNEAAIDAVKKWTYTPAMQNGEPVAAWIAVPVVFQMGRPGIATSEKPTRDRLEDTSPKPPDRYSLADVTIELSRTACFGSCPVYRLILRGTGECTYTGSIDVERNGDIPFHLDPPVVLDLLNDLYGFGFFRMEDFYVERQGVRAKPDGTVELTIMSVVDDPHQVLTVRIGAYVKRVEKNSMFGPRELVTMGEKIDKVTHSSQWVQVQPVHDR